ncbi:guanylate kinase [SAR202 cluster bacterium AC-409-J13_OGT_754m]|nr:guanylate kinase [SAR202 cluster bacterium AC-409-J13_OGT_754m]
MIELAKYRKTDGPLLVVVSGPSGVGKDSVFRYLKTLGKNWYFVITVTTRTRREDETNGVDYVFVDKKEFSKLKESGQLLEFARVYGNWYGTPKEPIEVALSKGMDVLMKTDVQGASTIKRLIPESVLIFLTPPSVSELSRRLLLRQSESKETLRIRIEAAENEMACADNFNYSVVNETGRLDLAGQHIESIIIAEKNCISLDKNS